MPWLNFYEEFRKSEFFQVVFRVFSSHAFLASLISVTLLAPPAFATSAHKADAAERSTTTHSSTAHHPTTTHSSTAHKSTRKRRHVTRVRGQQAIQPERVTQIQQALIREHYFTGEADGKWDATTIAAMQKYQADNGWQTKLMPDSRALKKLGLGPDYSDAINAKGANFGASAPAGDTPAAQTAGFTAASGVHQ